jgi:hypothetical protein
MYMGGKSQMIGHARQRNATTKPIEATERDQPKVEPGESAGGLRLTPLETSSYVLSMVTELRVLTKAAGFGFLTYLLEMAFQEAFRLTSELEEAEAKAQQTDPRN